MEEIAAKAKEAVTNDGYADESAKTEAANSTNVHAEASEASAAESTTESVPEPVTEKVELTEPVKAGTPVSEGESSALELQTPNFQGEAVR